MCETAQLYCYLGTIENRGKITASIHTPKRDVFISTCVYRYIVLTGINISSRIDKKLSYRREAARASCC